MARCDPAEPATGPGGATGGAARPVATSAGTAASAATAARRELAEAVRELAELVVDADVPGPVLAALAGDLDPLADELCASVGATSPLRSLGLVDTRAGAGPARLPDLHDVMLADIVVGPCNPFAAPLAVTSEGGVAVATGTFPSRYEGAPGQVQAGTVAAAFDIVLAAANRLAGTTGPTVELTLAQHHPTRTGVPVRLEATVVRSDDRRVVSDGRLVQEGIVTATATGTFAVLSLDEIRSLLDRSRRRRRPAP